MSAPSPYSAPPPVQPVAGPVARTPRNVELGLLIFAFIIIGIYTAAMQYGLLHELAPDFWVLPALLAALFLGLHVAIRFLAPYADPVIMPCVALLNGLGIMFLRRLDLGRADAADRLHYGPLGGFAANQLLWTLIAVGLTIGFLVVIKDHRTLSRYAYTLGLAGVVLVLIPAVLPGSLSEINGAKLWIRLGPFQIQPGE